MDSMAGSILLCFLDCYSGYHQIALHVDEEDKIAFITPHGILLQGHDLWPEKRWRNIPKGDPEVFEVPNRENVKAYVDDVVVKTIVEDKLIADLTETFANLREFQWKLNPTKCVFCVPSGLLLGFMVGH
jgi:hypothetical protein